MTNEQLATAGFRGMQWSEALRRRFLHEARLTLTCQLFASEPNADFFAKDVGGRYMVASPTLYLRLGRVDVAGIAGTTDRDHFPDRLAGRFGREDQEVIRAGESRTFECDLFCPLRGELIGLATTKFQLRNRHGTVIGVGGLSRRKPAERPGAAQGVSESGSTLPDAKLLELMAVVRANPMECFSRVELARRMGCSPSELNERVRECFGKEFEYLVKHLRICRIFRELIASCEPIGSISERCGFGSPSMFSTWFHKRTGLTPTTFRSRWQPLLRAGWDI